MKPKTPIAALSAQIQSNGSELKLLPAGEFRSRDGRPEECAAWHMDGAIAAHLIAAASSREAAYVIDYEHQTLNTVENGQPAPAAAWFKTLEWREGDGLYAVDVDWTARASAMVAAKEYRYLSPVFSYDKDTGNVTGIVHAGITNNPGLDNLDEIKIAALSMRMGDKPSADVAALPTEPSDTTQMNELLERLRWLLNMPEGSTAEDIAAQLDKLKAAVTVGQDATAAMSVDLVVLVGEQRDRIAALSANQIDLAKYVPLGVVDDLRSQIVALTAASGVNEVETIVADALSDGRLIPSMEKWARDLGASNVAALKQYIASAQPIAALRATQTQNKPPAGVAAPSAAPAVDDLGLAVCRQLGISTELFAKGATK